MAKILIIDDDASLLRALRVGLRTGEHQVATATSGHEGLTQTALTSPDLVVLDIGLPDLDGIEVSRRIREWSDVPIIILSATGDEESKIAALNGGANDYVTKPFSMGELEARIRAVLRVRPSAAIQGASEVVVGALHIDFAHHQVTLNREVIDLTAKEFAVLAFLVRHAGRTCTYQMILRAVWGQGYGAESHYVHAYVHRLRHRLSDPSGELIHNSPGVGYRLEMPSKDPAATRDDGELV